MRITAPVIAGLVAAGCSVGTPVGFSAGDHWTFPLVGPLEDGLLITPAMVHGHGPYLFAIDPDANISEIDKQIVEDAGLRIGVGPHRIDETNTGQTRVYAEALDFKIAGLTIERRDVMVFPVGLYDTEGRHIQGILGRDALAESLVFGFDRDHGIATLSTVKAFSPPPDSLALKYEVLSSASSAFVTNVDPQQAAGQGEGQLGVPASDVTAVPRRLTNAQIGSRRFVMHLDLGAAQSQLVQTKWAAAGLTAGETRLRVVDEAATPRDVTTATIAPEVTAGGIKTFQVTLLPYIEKRFADAVDGALGLDFFRPYSVYAVWDSHTYHVKLRGDLVSTAVARFGRWGTAIPPCPHAGCITATISSSQDLAGIDIVRDPQAAGHALEVFLGVTPATGKSAAPLAIELPAAADQLTQTLPADYIGATVAVLDVSPFPRTCVAAGGCVVQVGPVSTHREAVAPPEGAPGGEPAAPPPRSEPLDRLHRTAGDAQIAPSDVARRDAAGKPFAVAIVRLCIDPEGKVSSTKVVKSSGVPSYDEQLEIAIRSSWTFTAADAGVCTTATFVNH
jgi:TonB-like protein/aspartyl protease